MDFEYKVNWFIEFQILEPYSRLIKGPDTLSPDDILPPSSSTLMNNVTVSSVNGGISSSSDYNPGVNNGTSTSPTNEMDSNPSTVTIAPPKVVKLHKCNKCELPVAQRYELPNPEVNSYHLVLQHYDTNYIPQYGPVCGAASVAGTILSLLHYHGHNMDLARELITIKYVQDVYHSLGVPNIYETSAAVGNMTLKKCCMALKFPSPWQNCQLIIKDLCAHLERDPVKKMDSEWRTMKTGILSGARYLYHSRNHYNRIFGYRELWNHGNPVTNDSNNNNEDENNAPWLTWVDSSVSMKDMNTMSNENNPSLSPNPSPILSNEGGDNDSFSPILSSQPTNVTNPAERPIRPLGLVAKKRVLALASKANVVPKTGTNTATNSTDIDYSQCIAHRQVLMAKKGQRPQHWVNWEDICADIASHNRHHMIFEIRLLDRSK